MTETIVASSILILCILLVRKLCRGHISARLQYALWLVVAARLVIPAAALIFPNILPESDLSIINVANKAAEAAQAEEQQNNFVTSDGLPILEADGGSGADNANVGLFKTIWYVGIAAAGVWMAAVNIKFAHRLRRGRIRYEKEGFELIETVPVYLVKGLSSPCLYGMPGNQAIYLSEAVIEDDERLKHVIAHEYCHYKNKDIVWSALRCILTAVYWFNPLVWLAAAISKQDCELACDEAAIKLLGEEERIAYGKTLVSLITRKTKASDIMCAATTMTGGAKDIKERVQRIATKPRRLLLALLPVLVVMCAAAVLTFTQAKEQSEDIYILGEEGSFSVTTDCFQLTFSDSFANKAYYRIENDTDIIVYHIDSDREIGRFCKLPYEDAAKLTDGRNAVMIGSSGEPAKEVSHEYTPDEIGIEYTPGEVEVSHAYTPNEMQEAPAGVPGTDSNDDETTYIISDSLGGMQPIPAPEEVEKELIELPFKEETGEGVAVGTERSEDYVPDEVVPDEESEHVYLPSERVVMTNTAAPYRYLYVPADNSDAEQAIQKELSDMNRMLKELSADVRILSVSTKTIQETLDSMMENRTLYVGDSVKTSQIAAAIPTTDVLNYQYLSMDTSAEPYGVTLYYDLSGSYDRDDADMQFMGAALMFASIENLAWCNIEIRLADRMEPTAADMTYRYSREEMEKQFGPLYPYSENKEDFTDLYNRIVEYLESTKN